YMRAEIPGARTALVRALQLAREGNDDEAGAYAELVLAHVEHAAENEDAARDGFTRSVDRFRALALPWGIANALGGLAAVAFAKANNRDAERLADEALAVRGDIGAWFMSVARRVRAMLAVQQGRPDEAIAIVREGLAETRKLQDKFAFVSTLIPLAAA